MSMNGKLRAEMIARQKEELRRQRVRDQCNQMISIMESKLESYMNNVHYSSLFESDIINIKNGIQQSRSTVQSNPDTALSNLRIISQELNSSIAKVVSNEKKWSEDRENSYQQIIEMMDELNALTVRFPRYAEKRDVLVSKLDDLKNTATTSADIGKTLDSVKSEMDSILRMDELEEIRKETVKKIVSILKEQGFSISKPILKGEAVHINGKLPSGKKVLFQIYPEGVIDFDLDGYSGQTCQKEINGIIEKINVGEEIESSIEQFAWHNPDKIKKGSKEFPYGNTQAKYLKK